MTLFLSSDGDLCDPARGFVTVRPGFARTHAAIKTGRDFRETLRAGAYAWPGGYPLFFLLSDGETLSFAAARENARQIIRAIRDDEPAGTGWRVVACSINWEDTEMFCAHTCERIESAYGEPGDESERDA